MNIIYKNILPNRASVKGSSKTSCYTGIQEISKSRLYNSFYAVNALTELRNFPFQLYVKRLIIHSFASIHILIFTCD
jgi:hypothetical protein